MRTMQFTIQWHITSLCSNKCKHCYMFTEDLEKIRKKEPSLDDLRDIYLNICNFERKYNTKIKNFIITGGDPFRHKYFYQFIEMLHKDLRNITILGIPESITDENIIFMKENGITAFQVSIEGTREAHDQIRGIGSYDKTIYAIRKLKDSGIKVMVMYTIHKMNYNDLWNIIDELSEMKQEIMFSFDFLVTEGNAVDKDSVCQMLQPSEIEPLFKKYICKKEQLYQQKSKLILCCKNKMLDLMRIIREKKVEVVGYSQDSYCTGCYNGYTSLSILPNGDLLACRRLNISIGNLHKESLEKLFLGNEFMKKMRRPNFFEYCKDCIYAKVCRGCPAISYSFTGNPFAKNPYCFLKQVNENELNEYKYPPMTCNYQDEWSIICNTSMNKLLNNENVEMIRKICRNSL